MLKEKIQSFSFSVDDNGDMTVYIYTTDNLEMSVATISECEGMSNKECENLAIEALIDLGYEINF